MHAGATLQILETVCFHFWPDFLALKEPCLMILSILKEKEIIFCIMPCTCEFPLAEALWLVCRLPGKRPSTLKVRWPRRVRAQHCDFAKGWTRPLSLILSLLPAALAQAEAAKDSWVQTVSSSLIQQTMEKDLGFLTITLLQLYLELFRQLFKNEKGTIKGGQPSCFTHKVADSAEAQAPLGMTIWLPADPRLEN